MYLDGPLMIRQHHRVHIGSAADYPAGDPASAVVQEDTGLDTESASLDVRARKRHNAHTRLGDRLEELEADMVAVKLRNAGDSRGARVQHEVANL